MKMTGVFDALVANPLASQVGTPLERVDYWPLLCDLPDFRGDEPNKFGVSFIVMQFRDNFLVVSWSSSTSLRGSGAYHIQALVDSDGSVREGLSHAELIASVNANDTTVWSDAIGEPLMAVEVYGMGSIPHIIRFVFPSCRPVVAIGYSGEDISVGDGDDLLVFVDDGWRALPTTLGNTWELIWEFGASKG